MNGYTLIRNWYDFKFDNPDKVRHIHSDFYCYLVDQWNRLGQKQNFGLPTSVTMEALGIGSYNTYKKTLQDLIDFGFVKMVKESRNQHQSKIVALSKIDKATDKPLDKATAKATDKATDEPTDEPTDTIIEPLNNRIIEPLNKGILKQKQVLPNPKNFNFKNSLIELGVQEQTADDWIKLRKKGSNSETAFNLIAKEIIKTNLPAQQCIEIAILRGWQGLKADWIQNHLREYGKGNVSVSPVKVPAHVHVDQNKNYAEGW